jgi:hypothetical protein
MKYLSTEAPVFNDHATLTDSIPNTVHFSCINFLILKKVDIFLNVAVNL